LGLVVVVVLAMLPTIPQAPLEVMQLASPMLPMCLVQISLLLVVLVEQLAASMAQLE
jgi:hypothetical protein